MDYSRLSSCICTRINVCIISSDPARAVLHKKLPSLSRLTCHMAIGHMYSLYTFKVRRLDLPILHPLTFCTSPRYNPQSSYMQSVRLGEVGLAKSVCRSSTHQDQPNQPKSDQIQTICAPCGPSPSCLRLGRSAAAAWRSKSGKRMSPLPLCIEPTLPASTAPFDSRSQFLVSGLLSGQFFLTALHSADLLNV